MSDEKKPEPPPEPRGVECVPHIIDAGWETLLKAFKAARANDNPASLRDAIANAKAMAELAGILKKLKP